MRRTARFAATAAMALGLVAAVSTAPAAAGPGGQPGWNLIATYPTKSECIAVGRAGVPEKWDDWRCQPSIDPLAVTSTSNWDLWAVVYVG